MFYHLIVYLLLGFPSGACGKEPTCQCKRHKRGGFDPDPLEEGMATHSSILVWIIPWTKEPGGLLGTIVHGTAKSHTQLKLLSMHAYLLLWAEWYSCQNSYIDSLNPVAQNVTILGYRVFKKVITLKWSC